MNWDEAFEHLVNISYLYLSHEDRNIRDMAVFISSLKTHQEALKKILIYK